ncbi:EAL domain-containing protein [Deinococcus sp. HMF7604]|uniref:EAL domain-containing protein n=1 Tax=Deinococcus betulae TaxID=2873312 RepID=UPI001CCAC9DB|nr:EAL domain-containing protein [Deinococcus betulae]MBZ9749815.1 EAL domain-containing protein [Deinococcus betulae]
MLGDSYDNLPALQDQVDALNNEAENALSSSIEQAMAQALEASRRAQLAPYPAGAARAQMLMGYAWMLRGEFRQAITTFEDSIDQATRLHLPALAARSLNGLAVTHARMGHYGQAAEYHFRALQIVQMSEDSVGQARSLNNIGNLYMDLREHDQALKYHSEALLLASRAQVPALVSVISINMAIDYHDLGRFEEALALNHTSLAQARQAGFRHHECLILTNMAANCFQLGDLDAALSYAQDSIGLSEELGERENLSEALTTRGQILMRLGQLPEAEHSVRQALEAAQALKKRRVAALSELSKVLEAQGAFEAALGYAREYEQEVGELNADIQRHKTQVLSAQLKVERFEYQATQEQLRADELAQANAALQQAQARLAYQAQHDPLTGLLNRTAFEAALHDALSSQKPVGVLFIDLDHFKQVNDTLGHPVGDALLVQVAQRLVSCIREEDLVARQGGDEFTVLLSLHTYDEAELVATRILDTLSLPLYLAGRQLILTASIGLALAPQDGTDVTTLQKNADLAMYLAKKERGNVQRFQSALSEAAIRRLNLEQDLRQALPNGELELYYQPVVTSGAQQPVAVEALIRWNHPAMGLLPPDQFIPLAEENDLIFSLGAWVLQEACRQLSVWRRFWPELRVSINVSSRQFTQTDFASSVVQALAAHHLPASALELEVTETATLDTESLGDYAALMAAGLQLAVDDFGTGYSSIVRLFELPVGILKIDRSLVAALIPSQDRRRSTLPLIRSFVTYARESGLQVTAEGVETQEQLEVLKQAGCDLIQGFLIARPASAAQTERWLRQTTEREYDPQA